MHHGTTHFSFCSVYDNTCAKVHKLLLLFYISQHAPWYNTVLLLLFIRQHTHHGTTHFTFCCAYDKTCTMVRHNFLFVVYMTTHALLMVHHNSLFVVYMTTFTMVQHINHGTHFSFCSVYDNTCTTVQHTSHFVVYMTIHAPKYTNFSFCFI